MTPQYSKPLSVTKTPIPGFLRIDLTVHGDNRGWFKENWQRAKMVELGLPDLGPVQNNISFNNEAGVTRGIHAEPWDKFISVATGRVFGAWVDLRQGPSFGAVYTCEIDPSVAVYVPQGVGNAYQTLEPNTAYSYLVNAHWSPAASYTFLNLADETVAIRWPIPLDQAILSDKDKGHPRLADVKPFVPAAPPGEQPRSGEPAAGRRVLVTGANGQLGRELMIQLPKAGFSVTGVGHGELDITDASAVKEFDWSQFDTIVNTAAWTDVDGAETLAGRRAAWAVNATGPANLAQAALEHRLTLVHISSEYVFDGTVSPHTEDEPLSPLGVYGQSKAAGDLAVAIVHDHYIVRTSWLIGDGKNFVATMAGLANRGISPKVVDDQIGRLTFTEDLAAGIIHLLTTRPQFGIYNITNEGEPMTWADIAKDVFAFNGQSAEQVTPVSTEVYFANRSCAPRPKSSVLDLTKITSTGLIPPDARERMREHLS